MHFFGWIGRSDTTLYAISALTWTWTLGVLVLFLLKRLSLKVAISAFGIMMQLAESARIVYAAVERLEGFEETILFNQIISVALIFYLVMASVRHMPTIIAAISMATISFAYFHTEGSINRQMVVIFIIVEITTCVLGGDHQTGHTRHDAGKRRLPVDAGRSAFHVPYEQDGAAGLPTDGAWQYVRRGHLRFLRPSR